MQIEISELLKVEGGKGSADLVAAEGKEQKQGNYRVAL